MHNHPCDFQEFHTPPPSIEKIAITICGYAVAAIVLYSARAVFIRHSVFGCGHLFSLLLQSVEYAIFPEFFYEPAKPR